MLEAATPWMGRTDPEDGDLAVRWHHRVQPALIGSQHSSTRAILGFASDEGVKRNKGRPGAVKGPSAIRERMANLAWHHQDATVFDYGDVVCQNGDLEGAHETYADALAAIIPKAERTLVLGGGHEIAYGTFLGLHRWAAQVQPDAVLGIVNLDQHFDLRTSGEVGVSSGTPFFQIAELCKSAGRPFHYCCLGISEVANTQALFSRARGLNVTWRSDEDCATQERHSLLETLSSFLAKVDFLYLSLDLDVLPGGLVNGVSAPAPLGVPMSEVIAIIDTAMSATGRYGTKCIVADMAEYNPLLDASGVSARVAALLADRILFGSKTVPLRRGL